ncbi:hypothetical protein [Isoptericola sp. NPDC019482]|uniref:hypothetical protein n=1 Tax=Isoptericola sp. NPDC019482 TaxID=3154688 RepID=UPI00347584A7
MTPRTILPRTGLPLTTGSGRRPRAALLGVAVVGLAVALAGCSSSDAATSDTTAAADGQAQGQGAPGGGAGGGGRAPGVSGEVAAVDGTTAQVQGSDSQTAVTWTDDTTITVTVDGTLDDVAVGSCVVATSGATPGDDGATADEDAAAATVAVSEPTDGECAGGFGGGVPGDGDGQRPEGAPSDMPSGMPTDMPSGMPTDMPSGGPGGGRGGFGGLTSGKVTAVDGSTVTVSATSSDGESTEETVTVDDATVYTVQQDGSADDVAVGQCVTARGEEDDGGAVTATSLTVSSPGDDGCSTGFGGRGGFPGSASGGQGDGQGDAQGDAQDGGSDA